MIQTAASRRARFRKLRVLAEDRSGFTLAAAGLRARVSALAPDLFRLRIVRGAALPEAVSWAVVPAVRPEAPSTVERVGGKVRLSTDVARLELDLASGAWTLGVPGGPVSFEAGEGGGFEGAEARLDLRLAPDESLFGLGESSGAFNRRGLVREFWNIDVLGHASAIHPGLKSLYVSIPFALSLRGGRAAGLFWDNPARQVWDMGQTEPDRWRMTAASGEADLYLFTGPTPMRVAERYSELTGRTPLPPRWALGFQQCRYSYESRGRLEEVAAEFRRRRLPCDVLYLDIHHMDGYRVFTFGKAFPKPAAMMRRLADQGFHVAAIVDPGVKNDPEFGVLQRGLKADAFVKQADGVKDFQGEVWPGEALFPDFLNAGARAWWGDEQKALLDAGVAGLWNDMNEPANFARPDKTLAPDAVHRTDFGARPHAEVHNLYGMEMARASREGALRHAPDRRPFVITRAGYAGVQRHAAVWTGDNSSHWDHLNDSVQMLLNLSTSGAPFCGADAGGFLDNATPELFTRWFEFAAFTPFFRGHTNLGTQNHEPWAFGPEVEGRCRRILELRYRLLPLIYCLFAGARASGAPILRPLFWHYADDPVAAACGDQFLLGPDLLGAPVLRQGALARIVHLPSGTWFEHGTDRPLQGGDAVVARAPLGTMPLYVRAGGLVPMGPVQQFVGESPSSSVELHAWCGGDGRLDWYEDDGATNAYLEGDFHRRAISSEDDGRRFRLGFGPSEGARACGIATWRVVVHGLPGGVAVRSGGGEAAVAVDPGTGTVTLDAPNAPSGFTVEFRRPGAQRFPKRRFPVASPAAG